MVSSISVDFAGQGIGCLSSWTFFFFLRSLHSKKKKSLKDREVSSSRTKGIFVYYLLYYLL